jgi:hypothetical protein
MIKLRHLLPFLALAAGLLVPVAASANETPSGPAQLVPVDGKTDAAWLAKARSEYPLDTCVVSGESLATHGHGKQQDMIYREPGKPDRLVRFCCKSCIPDFKKEPAKYLKVLDEAAGKKPGP